MKSLPADKFFNDVNFTSIVDTVKGIYTSDGSMSTLLDFERVLDEADLYAYKNWILGELVQGPNVGRYTVTCVFMWPYKHKPDTRGAKRLADYGCVVKYRKDVLEYPIKLKNPSDFEPGTKMPKMGRLPVWLVTITVPKKLMQEITQGSLELEGETIDAEDIDQSYEEGLDDKMTQSAPAGAPTAPNAAPAPAPAPGAGAGMPMGAPA